MCAEQGVLYLKQAAPVTHTNKAQKLNDVTGSDHEMADLIGFEWSASSGVSLPRISWRGLAGTLAVLAIIDRRRIRGAAGKTIRTRWSPV